MKEPGGTQQIGWADTSIQTFTRFSFMFPILFLTIEDLEIIISDCLEEWEHEGSLLLGEKNTQQADASILGQYQPNHP